MCDPSKRRVSTAVKIYDTCLKILGQDDEGDRVKIEDLNGKDKRGLKSLKRRVKHKEIIVCRTDKSGRFGVLSREQNINTGEAHTDMDVEVELEEAEEIQRILDGHMRLVGQQPKPGRGLGPGGQVTEKSAESWAFHLPNDTPSQGP